MCTQTWPPLLWQFLLGMPHPMRGVKFGVLTCFGTQVNQLTFNNVKITFIDKKTILSANFIG
jgi:hypothetical protein